MVFCDGESQGPLQEIGTCPKKETGTRIRFWPRRVTLIEPALMRRL